MPRRSDDFRVYWRVYDAILLSVLAAALFGTVALMKGCSTMPATQAADSARDHLVVAETTFTSVANWAADMREAGVLGDTAFNRIADRLDEVSTALDAAHLALEQGRPSSTMERVAIVNRILLEVALELKEVPPDG